jgi:uncharacterized protein YbcI
LTQNTGGQWSVRLVLKMRHDFQSTMRDDLVALVERAMERKVVAFMSQNHIDPDMAVEVFIMEPRQDGHRGAGTETS